MKKVDYCFFFDVTNQHSRQINKDGYVAKMGFSDFWLQSNNGKKFCLDNLKELRKGNLGNNSALIKIFNIFDTKNADGTPGADGVLNKEELISLFNAMSNAAKSKGNASIFEDDEAEEYINTTQTSEGKSLKELGIKVKDKTIEDYQSYVYRELARGLRRGGVDYPTKEDFLFNEDEY